jgi:hypothetical protein
MMCKGFLFIVFFFFSKRHLYLCGDSSVCVSRRPRIIFYLGFATLKKNKKKTLEAHIVIEKLLLVNAYRRSNIQSGVSKFIHLAYKMNYHKLTEQISTHVPKH